MNNHILAQMQEHAECLHSHVLMQPSDRTQPYDSQWMQVWFSRLKIEALAHQLDVSTSERLLIVRALATPR